MEFLNLHQVSNELLNFFEIFKRSSEYDDKSSCLTVDENSNSLYMFHGRMVGDKFSGRFFIFTEHNF